MRNCCVSSCKSRWTKDGVNKKYHGFPRKQSLRDEWARAIGMKGQPKEHSRVCSDHFKVTDYTVTNYGDFPGQLRKSTVPSQRLPNSKGSPDESAGMLVTAKTNRVTEFTLPVVESVTIKSEPLDEDDVWLTIPQMAEVTMKIKNEVFETTDHASTLSKIPSTSIRTTTCGTQTSFINLRISYNTMSDPELVYGTGFERSTFNHMSDQLEQHSPISENAACIKKDSLLMTLFMLRHQMNFVMVQFIFGISRKILSVICQNVVDNLLGLLKRDEVWHKAFRDSRPFRCLIENIEKYQSRKKSSQ